jgi:DNA replication protein DnaC
MTFTLNPEKLYEGEVEGAWMEVAPFHRRGHHYATSEELVQRDNETEDVLRRRALRMFTMRLEAYRATSDEIRKGTSFESFTPVPARYERAQVELPELQEWLKAIARGVLKPDRLSTGPSLIISGGVGVGKTFQLYAARMALFNADLPVTWTITTAADLNGNLRKFDEHDAAEYARAAILAIDDLGANTQTAFNAENLYRIINHRYEHMLPTLITTNLDAEALELVVGERIASRLGEMCGLAVMEGSDRRGDA